MPIPAVIWELIEYSQDGRERVTIDEPERYTIQFLPEGELAVRADCNQVTGTYSAEDGTLDVTLGASTLVLCPPDSQAEPFQSLLDDVTSFAFADDGSLILSGDSGSLHLRPALTGVVWEWQDFRGNDDSLIQPDNPEDYTLTFLPEGKLAIQADCNRAIGAYAVEGAQIDLKIGGVTRMKCPPGSLMDPYLNNLNAANDPNLKDLDATNTYLFADGHLYIALPIDAGIMSFAPRPMPPAAATPEAG